MVLLTKFFTPCSLHKFFFFTERAGPYPQAQLYETIELGGNQLGRIYAVLSRHHFSPPPVKFVLSVYFLNFFHLLILSPFSDLVSPAYFQIFTAGSLCQLSGQLGYGSTLLTTTHSH